MKAREIADELGIAEGTVHATKQVPGGAIHPILAQLAENEADALRHRAAMGRWALAAMMVYAVLSLAVLAFTPHLGVPLVITTTVLAGLMAAVVIWVVGPPIPGSRHRDLLKVIQRQAADVAEKSVEALTIGLAESSTTQGGRADPATGTERMLAEVLADIMRVERVSVDSHFFDDLGADSMVMAHFCARVRKREDLPSVSMRDIYRYPTIRSLATALACPPDGLDPAQSAETNDVTTVSEPQSSEVTREWSIALGKM